MIWRLAADAVVLLHLAWIGFLGLGGLWGRKHRGVGVVHVGALGFAVCLVAFGWICPLTHLENWLRGHHALDTTYPGAFLSHYAERLVYCPLPRWAVGLLATAAVAINAWWYVGRRPPRPPGHHSWRLSR